jgi:integrase
LLKDRRFRIWPSNQSRAGRETLRSQREIYGWTIHTTASDGTRCHSWRTYATLHHEQEVSMRTLMDWLGHSMLETTIRYLAAADAGSLKTRSLVDKTWAVLADDQEAPL